MHHFLWPEEKGQFRQRDTQRKRQARHTNNEELANREQRQLILPSKKMSRRERNNWAVERGFTVAFARLPCSLPTQHVHAACGRTWGLGTSPWLTQAASQHFGQNMSLTSFLHEWISIFISSKGVSGTLFQPFQAGRHWRGERVFLCSVKYTRTHLCRCVDIHTWLFTRLGCLNLVFGPCRRLGESSLPEANDRS